MTDPGKTDRIEPAVLMPRTPEDAAPAMLGLDRDAVIRAAESIADRDAELRRFRSQTFSMMAMRCDLRADELRAEATEWRRLAQAQYVKGVK